MRAGLFLKERERSPLQARVFKCLGLDEIMRKTLRPSPPPPCSAPPFSVLDLHLFIFQRPAGPICIVDGRTAGRCNSTGKGCRTTLLAKDFSERWGGGEAEDPLQHFEGWTAEAERGWMGIVIGHLQNEARRVLKTSPEN
ncbi:hypothetical protein CDAR_589271 [Caerostris darwini]|uniref:Uncharacterized protein n=1 Tax=Caerostris darwini TaxID=1538125 RepID=A0AAV4TB79_9ARAC|nr:hypothetical protein CDAR_589271 [Caerostris darwini]